MAVSISTGVRPAGPRCSRSHRVREKAVLARHHHVEHRQVEIEALDQLARAGPAGRGGHPETRPREVFLEQFADAVVVGRQPADGAIGQGRSTLGAPAVRSISFDAAPFGGF